MDYLVWGGNPAIITTTTSRAWAAGEKYVLAGNNSSATNYAVAKAWIWECVTPGTAAMANAAWPASVAYNDNDDANNTPLTVDGTAQFKPRRPGHALDGSLDWSYATLYCLNAVNALAAGDRILLSHDHTENVSGVWTYLLPGTDSNPNYLLSVSRAGSGAVSLASLTLQPGAQIGNTTASGSNGTTINGSLYANGVFVRCGTSVSFASRPLLADSDYQVWENGGVDIFNANSALTLGSYVAAHLSLPRVLLKGMVVKTASGFIAACCRLEWRGGSLSSSALSAFGLIHCAANNSVRGAGAVIEGVDMSAIQNTPLVTATSAGLIKLENCKMPAGFALQLAAPGRKPGLIVELVGCDSAAGALGTEAYRRLEFYGEVAADPLCQLIPGTSTLKMDSSLAASGAAAYPHRVLETGKSFEFLVAAGALVTIQAEITHSAGTALTGRDFWLEAQYLGDSTTPKSSVASSRDDAGLISEAPAAAWPVSTATWALGAQTHKQTVSVSFIPQRTGVYSVIGVLAKAATQVWMAQPEKA